MIAITHGPAKAKKVAIRKIISEITIAHCFEVHSFKKFPHFENFILFCLKLNWLDPYCIDLNQGK